VAEVSPHCVSWVLWHTRQAGPRGLVQRTAPSRTCRPACRPKHGGQTCLNQGKYAKNATSSVFVWWLCVVS
jgi:hypothetical protein